MTLLFIAFGFTNLLISFNVIRFGDSSSELAAPIEDKDLVLYLYPTDVAFRLYPFTIRLSPINNTLHCKNELSSSLPGEVSLYGMYLSM